MHYMFEPPLDFRVQVEPHRSAACGERGDGDYAYGVTGRLGAGGILGKNLLRIGLRRLRLDTKGGRWYPSPLRYKFEADRSRFFSGEYGNRDFLRFAKSSTCKGDSSVMSHLTC